jgi:tRNA(Arg) A34 adenosine deaminase TadA
MLSKKKSNFIALAREQAHRSDLKHQHGCVAVSSGVVIAAGHNATRTRLLHSNVPSVHAEVACLSMLFRKRSVQREKEPELSGCDSAQSQGKAKGAQAPQH